MIQKVKQAPIYGRFKASNHFKSNVRNTLYN